MLVELGKKRTAVVFRVREAGIRERERLVPRCDQGANGLDVPMVHLAQEGAVSEWNQNKSGCKASKSQ